MLADLLGKPLTGVDLLSRPSRDPKKLVATLAARIKALLADHPEVDACEGIGVVVPGMVEHSTMRVLHAPTLGWRNVDLREPLAAATGLPVQIENSGPRLCAGAGVGDARRRRAAWPATSSSSASSDGVGVGVMIHGEVLRGRHNIAGEFGHVPLSLDGPRCSCGSNGCWEALRLESARRWRAISAEPSDQRGPTPVEQRHFTVEDLIARARARDAKASAALDSDGTLSRARAWRRSSTRSIPRVSMSAAKSRSPGDLIEPTGARARWPSAR